MPHSAHASLRTSPSHASQRLCPPPTQSSVVLMHDQVLVTPSRNREKLAQPTRRRPRSRREQSSSPTHRHSKAKRRRDSSASPLRNTRTRSPSPSAAHAPKRQRTGQNFQGGAGEKRLRSACTLCLGRFAHDPKKCFATKLWDGSKAHCARNEAGYLINPHNQILCSSWNQPHGCNSHDHPTRHECSGCGDKAHGAQRCPRAQAA